MKFHKGLLAAALLVAIPYAAMAQGGGTYLGGGIGANIVPDQDLESTVPAFGNDAEADFDPDVMGLVTLGFAGENGLRGEFELGRRSNDVDGIESSLGTTNATGEFRAWTTMFNILYDFNGPHASWTPYIGGGVGAVFGDVNQVGPTSVGPFVNDTDTAVAWQGIAGVSWWWNDVVQVYADYRYLGTGDLKVRTPGGPPGPSSERVEMEYSAHTAVVGFRWFFDRPEPPAEPVQAPPPPPAPVCEAETYMVFFDWDKAVLTGEARNIVQDAAHAVQSGCQTRIALTGHADRSGPADYNIGLSKRRAETVMSYLISLGIPAETMTVDWKGEADPLVPTPDGVREPQNRRTEIVLRP